MKRLFLRLVLCTTLVVPALLPAQPAGTIVMDNPDASFVGSWSNSDTKLSAKDRYGDDYKWTSTKETGGSKAVYRFKIENPGKYNVEIMYGQGGNRSAAAKWIISHASGQETVLVNQQINGGKWFVIGSELPFSAGQYTVELSNEAPEKTIVVADGVRIVPVSVTAAPGVSYTLNAIAAHGGKLTKSPQQTSFKKDEQVTLTAKADEGYVFDGWSGDATGYKNPLRLSMTGNKTVTANFIAAGIGVIMDNPMAKFEPSDKWQVSTTVWPGTRYEDYQFSTARQSNEARAIYTPEIPRAGKYDVYIWYAQGANRATKAPWSVVSASGTVKTNVNQQINGGKWLQIASSVSFEAGKKDKQYVEVNNGTGPEAAGSVVIADAVAFVYTGN